MANEFGESYGLTTLCPIINGVEEGQAHDKSVRRLLQTLPTDEGSPFAKIPNTYLARLFILNDVFFQQGNEVARDQLKSKYLVFTSNFHGKLDDYLSGMWHNQQDIVTSIWAHCVGFDQVTDAHSFIQYIKKCQLTTTLFFNGSTDKSLKEQLKALYVKQAFTEFALTQQNRPASELRTAFNNFMQNIQIDNLNDPSYRPGQCDISG